MNKYLKNKQNGDMETVIINNDVIACGDCRHYALVADFGMWKAKKCLKNKKPSKNCKKYEMSRHDPNKSKEEPSQSKNMA